MTDQQEIDLILQGIKKYAEFYGYGLERTVSGPNVGSSSFATVLRFNAFNGELFAKADKDGDDWNIEITLADNIGKQHFHKIITGSGPVTGVAKKLEDVLKELPKNSPKAVNPEEVFLQGFVKNSRYIVEQEYKELFEAGFVLGAAAIAAGYLAVVAIIYAVEGRLKLPGNKLFNKIKAFYIGYKFLNNPREAKKLHDEVEKMINNIQSPQKRVYLKRTLESYTDEFKKVFDTTGKPPSKRMIGQYAAKLSNRLERFEKGEY